MAVFRLVSVLKTRRVGLVDNSPSSNWLHHKKTNKKTIDMWLVTHDMRHVTRNIWHITCDSWGKVNLLSKFQLPSPNGLQLVMLWRLEGKRMTEGLNELRWFCRTAQATLGLLFTKPIWPKGKQNKKKCVLILDIQNLIFGMSSLININV